MRARRLGWQAAGRIAACAHVYLIILAWVTGCERAAPRPSGASESIGGASVAIIGPGAGHPQWPGIRGGVQRYLVGVPSLRADIFDPHDATSDSLAATVRLALDRRPNAVCMFVADPRVARESADMVLDAQVLLVTMGAELDDSRVAAHISADWASAAEALGDNLQRVARGRRSFLLVDERACGPEATTCYLRFLEAAERQYEMVLLQASAAPANGDPPLQVVADMLERFQHAGLVVTLSPGLWLMPRAGWQRELRQYNPTFRYATLGTAPALWRELGTPAVPGDAAALAGPLDGDIGFAALETVVHVIVNPNGTPPSHTVPCELVTAETLSDFARRYSAAANGLDVSLYLPHEHPATEPRSE